MSSKKPRRRMGASGAIGRIVVVSAIAALVSLAAVAAMASSDAQAQAQAPPTNTGEPGISGNAVQGQTLTGTTGAWTGSPSYTFSWRRCGSDGGLPDASNCPTISGASGTTYVLTSDDVGFRIRIRVTATNADGTQSAASNATSTVTATGGGGGAPVSTGQPVISGDPSVGSSLTASQGSWSNSPTGYAYQWVRCNADGGASDGSNCGVISGATATSYTVQGGDNGFRLRVQVRATNGSGTTLAASNATNAIGASGAPRFTAAPTVGGSTAQGSTLATSNGSWTGASPISYAYQWLRCNTAGGACSLIAGATKNTYVLTASDVGKTLRSRVTAKNGVGTSTADSNQTATVTTSGGGGGGPLPPGAIKLPDGKTSIPITSVSLPNRLVVSTVKFAPNPVTTRTQPFTMRVRVFDTRGYVVRDALVFVRSTPVLTNGVPELRTAQDGWATFSILPRADFPLRNGYSVQFFVRTRKAGEDLLAGVSSRRLVQVGTRGQ
jgi:hypothetical protein